MTIDYVEDAQSDTWGEFNIDKESITLNLLGNPSPHEILVHEAVHAALGFSGLSQILTHEQEEAVCRAIQYGLAASLQFAK